MSDYRNYTFITPLVANNSVATIPKGAKDIWIRNSKNSTGSGTLTFYNSNNNVDVITGTINIEIGESKFYHENVPSAWSRITITSPNVDVIIEIEYI